MTAIASEITSGKQAIAAAINAKGGTASATESFNGLAQDVINLNDSFITYGVEVTEKIHWLKFICDAGAVARLPLTAIDDDIVTTISQSNVFQNCSALESVKMTALTTISGNSAFSGLSALQEVNLPNLVTISGGSVFQS
ncbi:MAG: leucine-rich repeat protein, partial [Ruminococcus sp.]|nr:leucine-rich repeat protein [Ruminococcus sp.]